MTSTIFKPRKSCAKKGAIEVLSMSSFTLEGNETRFLRRCQDAMWTIF